MSFENANAAQKLVSIPLGTLTINVKSFELVLEVQLNKKSLSWKEFKSDVPVVAEGVVDDGVVSAEENVIIVGVKSLFEWNPISIRIVN